MSSTNLANVTNFPHSLREALLRCTVWVQDQLDAYDMGEDSELRPSQGICGHLMDARQVVGTGFHSFDSILESIFEQWPEYSGNPVYPVPGTEDDEENMYLSEFYDDSAEYAYEESDDVWEGTYGESRRALLTYIYESVRASLPITSEDPKASAPVSPAAAYKPTHGGYPG